MAKRITVSGADVSLFHVAARELNDATQWIRIAQANGLSDPMLSAVISIFIPDINPAMTGGIPSQIPGV